MAPFTFLRKVLSAILLTLLVLNTSAAYGYQLGKRPKDMNSTEQALREASLDKVKSRVGDIKIIDPALPDVAEQKGKVGTIISELFGNDYMIKEEFISGFSGGRLESEYLGDFEGDVNQLIKWNGNQLDSTSIYDEAGKVGIGAPSNGAELYLNSDLDTSFEIQKSVSGAQGFLESVTNYFRLGTRDASDIRIRTNNDDIMTITKEGRVGVATMTPTGIFEVNSSGGSFYVSDIGSTLIERDTGNVLIVRNTLNDASNSYNLRLERGDGSGTTAFMSTIGDGLNGVSRLGIGISSIGELATLTSSGRVGIGNINPSYDLDISGDLNFTGNIYKNGLLFHPWKFIDGTNPNDAVYLSGSVIVGDLSSSTGIGANSQSLLLDVEGAFGASSYCDENGENCVNASALIGNNNVWGLNAEKIYYNVDNVGIGTIDPDSKLQVVDSVSGTAQVLHLQNTDSGINQTELVLSNAGQSGYIGTDRTAVNAGVDLYFSTNNSVGTKTEVMRITEGGNVGIGTTSPAKPLHVNGETRIASAASSNWLNLDGGDFNNNAEISTRFNNLTLHAAKDGTPGANFNIVMKADNSTKMLIQGATGNVGVGTNNPDSRLHIVSKEIGDGQDKGLRISNYNETQEYSFRTGVQGVNNTAFTLYDETNDSPRFVVTSLGKVGIGTTSPNSFLTVNGDLELSSGSVLHAGNQHYNVAGYNRNGTPTHGVKIKTNLPYVNSSQMPTIKIEGYNYGQAKTIDIQLSWYIYNGNFTNVTASSSGGYTPPIKLANESGNVVIFIDDRQYYNRFAVRAYSKGMSIENNPDIFKGWTVVDEALTGTNQVDFVYNNSFENVAVSGNINVSGNVGIGTSSPTERLHVDGNIIASDPTADNHVTTKSYVDAQVASAIDTDWVESGANVYKLTGNVGIGDISPVTLLDLGPSYSNPSTVPNKIALWHGGDNNYMGFGVSSSDLDYFSQGNHRFYVGYNGTPGTQAMAITAAGRVGIGTGSPTVPLDVIGEIEATTHITAGRGSGGAALTTNDGYGNANLTFNHARGIPEQDGVAARIEVNTDAGNGAMGRMDFELGTNLTAGSAAGLSSIMRLRSDGNIGIGTLNPTTKLHVEGNIFAQAIKTTCIGNCF